MPENDVERRMPENDNRKKSPRVTEKEGARVMTARRRVCRKTGAQEESGAGKEIWIWANVLFC